MTIAATQHLCDFINAVADECGVTPEQLVAVNRLDDFEPALVTITNYIMQANRARLDDLRRIQAALRGTTAD